MYIDHIETINLMLNFLNSFFMKKVSPKKLSLKKIKLNDMTLNEQDQLQGGYFGTSFFRCATTVQSRTACVTGNPGTQDSCGLCTTHHYC